MVETIDFFREEENELPPPMALKEVVALNKAAPYEGDDEDADEDGAQSNGRPQDMQVCRRAAAALCADCRTSCGMLSETPQGRYSELPSPLQYKPYDGCSH